MKQAKNKRQITLFGSGKPMREFIYSEDVASAVLFLLNKIIKMFATSLILEVGRKFRYQIWH